MLEPLHRRGALRRGHRTPCRAVAVDRFRSVGERLVDLSHRGARLALSDAVEPGETVVVSFVSPGGTRTVDVVAEVRRVEDGTCGLFFRELAWDDRAALFVELAGVPPPVPKRRAVMDYARSVRRIARR